MKKFLSIVLSVLVVISLFSGCSKKEYTFENTAKEGEISVVSFNCAAPWGNVLKGTSSSKRVKRFAAYMNAVKPDSIGTQEMNQEWVDSLAEIMSDYDCYAVARGGDDNEKKSEMNAIFWNKEKFSCIASNTFWLTETPDEESKYDGAGCNRICSYVVLQNNSTGEKYIHMNTHLDNASAEAREFGAKLIMQKLEEFQSLSDFNVMPVVLTGDFNDTAQSEPYNIITKTLKDCSSASNEKASATYTDWGKATDGEPIDFIFSSNDAVSYAVLNDISNGYISDHYGIFSIIKL
ncbi:MAG: endonuclease/exonuclease/phosphatase family protein [Eubacterium sp.]